jgi:hypothetical protein
VVQSVPSLTLTHALEQLLSSWQMPHVGAVHPDPPQQVPPHPSLDPHATPPQLGAQTQLPDAEQMLGGVHEPHDPPQVSSPHVLPAQSGVQVHTPLWQVASPAREKHGVPFARLVQVVPQLLSSWQSLQSTGTQPEPAQHVPPQPSD